MRAQRLNKGLRCLNCALRSSVLVQRRTFASSPAHRRHGSVPSFTPTSNPELDELFATLRNKLFMPSHLSQSQRDLIFKEKNRRTLEIEPVFAILSGEKFQLENLRPVEGGRKALFKALKLMREPKDWDNLLPLLIGLKNSRMGIDSMRAYEASRIARMAGMAGRLDIILECARRVSDTDFKLKMAGPVREILWQLQHKAFKSEWSAKETWQATSWAEMTSELLEDKRHAGGKVADPETDVRVQPEIIGILLQLSAARAIVCYDGKDRDGAVARYSARLLGSPALHFLKFKHWLDRFEGASRSSAGLNSSATAVSNLTSTASTTSSTALNPPTNPENSETPIDENVNNSQPLIRGSHAGVLEFGHSNEYLTYMVPVLHGLKLAASLLGPVERLSKVASELEESIAVQRENLLGSDSQHRKRGNTPRGLTIYDQLLAPDAKEVISVPRRANAPTENKSLAEPAE